MPRWGTAAPGFVPFPTQRLPLPSQGPVAGIEGDPASQAMGRGVR